jgi:hypothetical protein
MQIFNTRYYLLEVFASFFLLKPRILDNIVKQFTSTSILHDQIELFGCFNNLIKLNNVGVPDHLENFDLSGDPLHVCLLCDLGFL